jgi:hypothetical protein
MLLPFRVASIAFLLSLAACVHTGQLEPVPAEVQAGQAGRVPLNCVDVLVFSRPGFEARKVLGFIAPPQSTSRTLELSTKVESVMTALADELRYTLSEAGGVGVVRTNVKGYVPSACRTHLVTVVPTEASQGGGGGPFLMATVQVTVYEVADKHQLWQSTTSIVEGRSNTTLSQSLLSALQSLGMKSVPKAPVPLVVPGLPFNLGDPLPAIQATLGTSQEPVPVKSALPTSRFTALKLADRGLDLLFNEDNRLTRIQLVAPYADAVKGVRIGDSRSTVLRALGEPTREQDWTPTQPTLVYRTSAGSLGFDFELKGTVKAIWIRK